MPAQSATAEELFKNSTQVIEKQNIASRNDWNNEIQSYLNSLTEENLTKYLVLTSVFENQTKTVTKSKYFNQFVSEINYKQMHLPTINGIYKITEEVQSRSLKAYNEFNIELTHFINENAFAKTIFDENDNKNEIDVIFRTLSLCTFEDFSVELSFLKTLNVNLRIDKRVFIMLTFPIANEVEGLHRGEVAYSKFINEELFESNFKYLNEIPELFH